MTNPFPRGSAGYIAHEALFGTPVPGATSPVALRQSLIAQNPNLTDAEISRAESRIKGEAVRADLQALGAQLQGDWDARRLAAKAEADAFAERVMNPSAETDEQRQERRRAAIARENLL
jgi:hypothetical protein